MSSPASPVPAPEILPDQQQIGLPLLVVLAFLQALGPLGIGLYLPAFPRMATDLETSNIAVQVTLTAFLAGLTLGQLAFGVVSDRYGRFRPLLTGALLCVGASLVAALAANIETLIAARFVQGLAGAAGLVIGRAIIADLAKGQSAARAFSLMMMVSAVAPVVAPFAGSLLVEPLGWRGVLAVLCGLATLMAISIMLVVRETMPRHKHTAATEPKDDHPNRVLRSRTFIGPTLAVAFAFAVLMAYVAASPFVYQAMMGMTPVQYGLAFAVNALGISAASAASAKLAASVRLPLLFGAGLFLMFGGCVLMLILAVVAVPPLWAALPIFVSVSSLGLIFGNGTALALGAVREAAGRGSAVLGAVQFGLAAAITPLVGLGGEQTAIPLAIVMLTCATLAIIAFAVSGASDAV